MRASQLLATAALSGLAQAGFATYKEIVEGADNSGEVAYYDLDRSNTLFLYIQIVAGQDHQSLINDFKTLARNYGTRGISVVPRVRYGYADGSIGTEPEDASQILKDVSLWASVFKDVTNTIKIPVIQAGFLGMWGEWHSGHFTQTRGSDDSKTNLDIKGKIVETLLGSGHKVALRYPEDHYQLYNNNRTVTIHNDCIFNSGPLGSDGGTFPDEDRDFWVEYTKSVASGNTYGGEPCDQSDDSTYDWKNYNEVCGSNGLEAYINEFQISYLNPGNPYDLQLMFNNPDYADCIDDMGAALNKYS